VLNNFSKVLDLVIVKAFKLHLNLVESLFTNKIKSFTSKLPYATI
jgi:hypothetical protein